MPGWRGCPTPNWTTFRRVVLPAIKPSIAAGTIFTFSLSLGDYIAVQIVGGNLQVLGTAVLQNITLDLPFAAALGTSTVALFTDTDPALAGVEAARGDGQIFAKFLALGVGNYAESDVEAAAKASAAHVCNPRRLGCAAAVSNMATASAA